MALLAAGMLVFTLVHLYPAVFVGSRGRLIARLGRNPYRGLFSLAVLAGLIVIVAGWRSAVPEAVYTPPISGRVVPALLVFLAFVLLVAAQSNTNIKRYVRHPQMSGVVLWSVAHLLSNGDSRSVLLFGGLGAWAVAEQLLCNRRDGAWQRPGPFPVMSDVITVAIAIVGFIIIWRFHGALSGVPLTT